MTRTSKIALILLLGIVACERSEHHLAKASGPVGTTVGATGEYLIGRGWVHEFRAHHGKLLCVKTYKSVSCVANKAANFWTTNKGKE